jgi:tetratricopeptide (TPR) repeat protein
VRSPFFRRKLWLAVACALLGAGCDRLFDKGARNGIQYAEQKARSGDFAAAVLLYERALDGSPRSAEIHFRLGLLYADKLQSPVDALHHFGRYLALAPSGPRAKEAQTYKEEGERKIVGEFSKGNVITQAEALRLKNENLRLLETVAQLRNAQKLAQPVVKAGEEKQKPIPPGARTYTVQPGDNFGKISMKFYKTKAKALTIQNANFNPQAGTPVIRPGMVLMIP